MVVSMFNCNELTTRSVKLKYNNMIYFQALLHFILSNCVNFHYDYNFNVSTSTYLGLFWNAPLLRTTSYGNYDIS